MNEKLLKSWIKLYKNLNELDNFFNTWLKQHTIQNRIITPIEMKILYGLKYENLKIQRDIEKHYDMYRSTIIKVLRKLKSDGLLTIEIKTTKNHKITLTQTGNEIIESIFTQITTYYKDMVKKQNKNDDEQDILHECCTTTEKATLNLGRIMNFLLHKNKKI